MRDLSVIPNAVRLTSRDDATGGRRFRRALIQCFAGLALLSCGGDRSTNPPSGTGTSPTPSVTGVQPASISATTFEQSIMVVGQNFDATPTLVLTSPSNQETLLSGTQLTNVGRTSLTATTVIGASGAWRAHVKSANGQTSNTISFTVSPAPPPTLKAASPAAVTLGVNQLVTITGSGFQRGLSAPLVSGSFVETVFSGTLIEDVTPESFSIRIGVGDLWSRDLYVVNPDGQVSATSVRLKAGSNPVFPTITGVSPTSVGSATVPQVLTITGTNLNPVALVLSGPSGAAARTYSAPAIYAVSPTTVQAFVTLDVAGTWQARISNTDAEPTNTFTFVVGPPSSNVPPAPAITSVSPSGLVVAAGEQLVTLQGTGFKDGMTAIFTSPSQQSSSPPVRVVSIGPTSAQFGLELAFQGGWSVRIRNPDGALSNSAAFTVGAPPGPIQVPVITSVSPSTIETRLSDQVISLSGTGFTNGMNIDLTPPAVAAPDLNVTCGQVTRVTYLSPARAESPVRLECAGTWQVRLINSAGTSAPFDFVVRYPNMPAPVITGIDPVPYASAFSQLVRIRGSNFAPGLRLLMVADDSVRFAAPPAASVDLVTPTEFRLSAVLRNPGRIQVRNPDGRLSNVFRFATQPPLPVITGLGAPVVVSTVAQKVSLVGSYLQAGLTAVLTPAGSAQTRTVSTTLDGANGPVSFTALLDIAGTWKVQLSNSSGLQSNEFSFIVGPTTPLTLTAIGSTNPRSDHNPQMLTITGTGFTSSMQVQISRLDLGPGTMTFSGSQIANLTNTSCQISPVLFPAGEWVIVVTNPESQRANHSFVVSGVASPPTISSISPTTFDASGALRLVAVTGSGFHTTTSLVLTSPTGRASGGDLLQALNLTATSFQMLMAFDLPGTWTLVVRNADGQASAPFNIVVR